MKCKKSSSHPAISLLPPGASYSDVALWWFFFCPSVFPPPKPSQFNTVCWCCCPLLPYISFLPSPPLQASQFNMEHFSGMHNWYACSHARPTFCNVCREALPGVTSHGLSCEGTWTHTHIQIQTFEPINHGFLNLIPIFLASLDIIQFDHSYINDRDFCLFFTALAL